MVNIHIDPWLSNLFVFHNVFSLHFFLGAQYWISIFSNVCCTHYISGSSQCVCVRVRACTRVCLLLHAIECNAIVRCRPVLLKKKVNTQLKHMSCEYLVYVVMFLFIMVPVDLWLELIENRSCENVEDWQNQGSAACHGKCNLPLRVKPID